MVKVKEEGKIPLCWKAEVKCEKFDQYDNDGCGAVLEATEKDLVFRYWLGSHFTHYYATIKCPCCGKYTKVKVPNSVWERIDTAKNRKKATHDGFSDR